MFDLRFLCCHLLIMQSATIAKDVIIDIQKKMVQIVRYVVTDQGLHHTKQLKIEKTIGNKLAL